MQVNIRYLYHSCFSIEVEKKILLFDYPGREVTDEEERELDALVTGKDLYIFISHSHGDHFSSDVSKFSKNAKKTYYLISKDVSFGHHSIDPSDILTEVGPDSSYSVGDVEVKTFESNDAGVAFLIEIEDLLVYFGGDLAKWDWPEWSREKREKHVNVFDKAIQYLKAKDIDIAFSNMDERLSSWAGPIDFIEQVKPDYFVPIHTFGNEEWINDLIEEGFDAKTKIFQYEKPGDEIVWEI